MSVIDKQKNTVPGKDGLEIAVFAAMKKFGAL
jgi:hypothetical protein